MPDHVDIERILEKNPRVDRHQLEGAQDMLRRLRERGVRRKGYDLAPPYGGRRVSALEDTREAPGLLRLRRPTGLTR